MLLVAQKFYSSLLQFSVDGIVKHVLLLLFEVILREREERKQNRLLEETDPARLVAQAGEIETDENPSETSLTDHDQHLTGMKTRYLLGHCSINDHSCQLRNVITLCNLRFSSINNLLGHVATGLPGVHSRTHPIDA